MDYLARQAHAVEEDRIALPFDEAAFVSQVLRYSENDGLCSMFVH